MKRFKYFEIDDMTWYHILDFRDKNFSKYAKLPVTSDMTKEQVMSIYNDMVSFQNSSITDVEEPKFIYFHLIPGVHNQVNNFLIKQKIHDWHLNAFVDGVDFGNGFYDGMIYDPKMCIYLQYRKQELMDYGITGWEENHKNNYNDNGKK